MSFKQVFAQWLLQASRLLRMLVGLVLLAINGHPVTAQAPAAPAERRVALVVGNASYERAPLANPLNDAADLAAALRRVGFEVLERSNRNPDQMRRDLADFQDKLGPGVVGLFYFAGHGVQAGRGLNYLLPVGVDYRRERDAELYGLEAGAVLRRMEEAGSALSLVILDACRDSPLPPEGRSSGSRGLGRMEAPSGSLVAFATAPGSTADENRGARNGLYTQHLLATIETPGLRVEDVFKRVRTAVERASNRRQSPEEVNKLTSDFYFVASRPLQPPVVAPMPAPLAAPSSSGSFSMADLEREQGTRAQWAEWQGRMQADYNRAAAFSGSADLQVQAWQRFLQAWGQDNPTSAQDEQLRVQAQVRLTQAQRAVQMASVVPEPVRAPVQSTAVVSPGKAFTDCTGCPEMVVVPAGSFMMGSPETELNRSSREGPQRWVNVQMFAASKTEVTFEQWDACVADKGCAHRPADEGWGRGSRPVINVSWNDAQEYVRWLSRKSGRDYRLLSEAEWEYAARAGTTAPFHTGATITAAQANFEGTNDGRQKGEYRQRTIEVGQFPANAFGLHDMLGNAEEWVQDVYHANYSGAPTDGSAWVQGGSQGQRVRRGGSWGHIPSGVRSAYRFMNIPDARVSVTGFRIARTL